MKCKYILHIPTGYYFNYSYYPKGKKACRCVLTTTPPIWRKDDTDILNRLEKWQYSFTMELADSFIEFYDSSFNELMLVELDIHEDTTIL